MEPRPRFIELPFPARPTDINYYFLRHGEPLRYGDTHSPLSPQGKEQLNRFTTLYIAGFPERERCNIVIFILYSGRLRTQESALVVHNDLLPAVSRYENVLLLEPTEQKLLFTADTIDPLLEAGTPLEDAYARWLMAPADYLHSVGARTPVAIFTDLRDAIVADSHTALPGGRDVQIDIIGITHETTHGAFISRLFPQIPLQLRIDYAEPFMVHTDLSQRAITYSFRGHQLREPLSDDVLPNS